MRFWLYWNWGQTLYVIFVCSQVRIIFFLIKYVILQVNLDSKTRLDTVTNLDNPTRDMYKSAQKRIQYLMEKDPYPRFLQSEIYLQLARQSSRCDSR